MPWIRCEEVRGLDELERLAGQEVGASEWLAITQEMVDRFADTTFDHQWIHCDVERARRESPYGGPVAHGFLTLSLIPGFRSQILTLTGVSRVINYGVNRVAFSGGGARWRACARRADGQAGRTEGAGQSAGRQREFVIELEGGTQAGVRGGDGPRWCLPERPPPGKRVGGGRTGHGNGLPAAGEGRREPRSRGRAYSSSAKTKSPLPPTGRLSSGIRSAGIMPCQLAPPAPTGTATYCRPSTA